MTIQYRNEGISSALAIKAQVRVATTANITLSGEQTIDGIAVVDGDRVLVKDQTDATTNGIYNASTGTWARAKDFDANSDFKNGTHVYVQLGTQAGRWLVSSSDPHTVGTSNISFSQVPDSTLVNNTLTSDATDEALSAAQGKALKALVDAKLATSSVVSDRTTGGTTVPLSAEMGKELSTKRDVVTKTADHTLVLGDAGYTVEMNVGSANTLTIPPNSDVAFPINTFIEVVQIGAGQTTIAAGSGVTIRSSGAKLKLTGQYSAASFYQRATDDWVLAGDITS